MKIMVINGTGQRRITYRLKEKFLENFKDAEITEFYLPKDCPAFCVGCVNCVLKGKEFCKDAGCVQPIVRALDEADLIVMTTPAYVFHATGAMKSFLDHLAYRWMAHRPSEKMFSKRAVIISQCLGAGVKSAVKDVKDSLSWWGVSKIGVFKGKLMGGIDWEKLPERRKKKLEKGIARLSKRFARIDYGKSARTKLTTKVRFLFCRLVQKAYHGNPPVSCDDAYWTEKGWYGKARPWKN